jgi:hypothetical protein
MELQSEFRHARAVRRERRAPISAPSPSELWSADYGSPISAEARRARPLFPADRPLPDHAGGQRQRRSELDAEEEVGHCRDAETIVEAHFHYRVVGAHDGGLMRLLSRPCLSAQAKTMPIRANSECRGDAHESKVFRCS